MSRTARVDAYERIDWQAERDRIDLAAVAIRLLGQPPGRMGERGYRLWWCCPFHEDRNPSFLIDPGGHSWHCFGCGAHGDAASLVMKLRGVTFPEALAYLLDRPAPSRIARPRAKAPARPVPKPPAGPSGLPEPEARALIMESSARLWTPEGVEALAYLTNHRYLTPETIRSARLGWTPGVLIPKKGGGTYEARGVVIPWFDGDRLAMTKIRQPDGFKLRYAEAFRDRPSLYPGRHDIRPGHPLVIVEGDFDALILGQELGELAAVVTLGSASGRPVPGILGSMLTAPRWFIATDADDAGDKSAARWPARARRARPPGSFKDWTEARQAGVDLRRWWSDRLAGEEAPALFSWDELAAWRWGPAVGDAEPGIVVAGRQAHPAPPGTLGGVLWGLRKRGIRLDDRMTYPRVGINTVTGRIGYTDPPLQTLPKAERLARLAPVIEGRRFVQADYGQIEPRILLSILRGRGWITLEPGEDFYLTLAGGATDRDNAKQIVNKVINGGRPPSGMRGPLSEFINAADAYRSKLAKAAKKRGFVRTLAGRAIDLAAHEPNFAGKAVNRVVQGTAADIFNDAVVRVAVALEASGLTAAIAFLLFDELWVEADPAEIDRVVASVLNEMEAAALSVGVTIPVRIDSDQRQLAPGCVSMRQ